jgi:4'-phosphopantetheinyl transferase
MYPIKCLPLPESVPSGIEAWLLELDLHLPVPDSELALVSEEERLRALRFRRHEDRVRSVGARAALRRLLGAHLMLPPSELRFVVNPYGKPQLDVESGIEFNVSHAGSFALIALSTSGMGGQVGVDIEQADRAADGQSLAEYVFSPFERRFAPQTGEYFIQRWAAKEAVLKALGCGIADHLQSVSVLPAGGEAYEITHGHAEWPEIKAWRLLAPHGYAAALALTTHDPFLAREKYVKASRLALLGTDDAKLFEAFPRH